MSGPSECRNVFFAEPDSVEARAAGKEEPNLHVIPPGGRNVEQDMGCAGDAGILPMKTLNDVVNQTPEDRPMTLQMIRVILKDLWDKVTCARFSGELVCFLPKHATMLLKKRALLAESGALGR